MACTPSPQRQPSGVGPDAVLVHVGLTALLLNAGADLFINTCYNYPTLTEVYKYAAYAALGQQAARRKQRETPSS